MASYRTDRVRKMLEAALEMSTNLHRDPLFHFICLIISGTLLGVAMEINSKVLGIPSLSATLLFFGGTVGTFIQKAMD